jgi:serine phosphatase RsbU (regulator of sigma subunit)
MLYDSSSGFWIGTDEGIQVIRTDSGKHVRITKLQSENQDLVIGHVFDIKQDDKHNFWLATEDGLIYYDPVRNDVYRYTPYDQNLLNTEHKEVYTIVPVNGSQFWIGTSKGVYRFDVPKRVFDLMPDEPGVISAPVKILAMDKQNNIWIGSGRGVYVFNYYTGTTRYFDHNEGLISQSIEAVCADSGGRIYLGGSEGLSMVDAEGLPQRTIFRKVLISSVRIITEEPRKDKIYYHVSDTLVIPWKRKPLRIEFAETGTERPEFSRFRYSFEKPRHDPVWNNLDNQNYVVIGHLSPGRYRFMVTTSTSESPDERDITSVLIIVEASNWRSTRAVVIYFVLGAVFLLVMLRLVTRQFFSLSRENQEKEMYALQIMLQKEELTLKNKSITDSINYAKRIQTAMLPPVRLFKSIFTSSFVLYMPKDIVSGDFYWINKLNDRIFVAAVDCTGHGVPGAFMSIIGFELFRKITNIEGLKRPSDILNRLNEDFHVIFKDVDNVILRDGMDVAFCSIDKTNMILEFAGAFNPLYLIRDNKITEIKGDRFAIGLDETNFKDQTFKNHLIPIQKGDIIYIFSDGFADQFGGPDGKKYKYRRFRHLLLNLHQLPMDKQHEILENNVLEWRGEQEQVDDILVIGIKIDF